MKEDPIMKKRESSDIKLLHIYYIHCIYYYIYTGCPGGNVKVYRYNPKHLYPKLNGHGDNGERKVWSSCGSMYCICFVWRVGYGYGYIGARNDTTQQLEQTPDKELELKNITVYVSGYTETNTTGMLSPPTVWHFSVAM
jgi:hypothetical protein